MTQLTDKNFVKNTLNPMSIDMTSVVARCSLTPIKIGLSPGAVFSDMTFNEFICDKANTVAATNHGSPNNEHMTIVIQTINKSKWKPFDFF